MPAIGEGVSYHIPSPIVLRNVAEKDMVLRVELLHYQEQVQLNLDALILLTNVASPAKV